MKKKLTQYALFQSLKDHAVTIPEHRQGKHIKYVIPEVALLAFSIFFLQSPSLEGHLELLKKAQGKRNKYLLGIKNIPTAPQIRNILDPIDPAPLYEVQDDWISRMQRSGVLKQFHVSSDVGYLLAIDGTEFFRSKHINCSHCCQCEHSNGIIDYHHRVLLAGMAHPEKDIFLPVTQEFIVRQDGCEKEDCELNAGKRLITAFRERHRQLKCTILADDLFCKQPILEQLLANRMGFIISCKPGSHKHLFEWIGIAREGGDLGVLQRRERHGKRFLNVTYEFANDVPIKDDPKALKVNFVEMTIRDTNERIIGRQSFVTQLKITKHNCGYITSLGRKKWKIENEGNNTLKNFGYHLEHNYGHGSQHLSEIFALMSLLAFMMHVILNIVKQEGFARVRGVYKTLKACIEAIRGAFRLIGCASWEQLYVMALGGYDSS